MEEKLLRLRKFNRNIGAVHLIQGIIMLVLAFTVIKNISEFTPTITQNFIQYNPVTESLEVASKSLFTLPFGVLVASFLFISTLAHAIIALPARTNNKYIEDLAKGINQFRWYEYALSSSIMIVLIATLFGIYDIASLLLIFFANATMNLFGFFIVNNCS